MSVRNQIKTTAYEYDADILESSNYRWISGQLQKRAYEYSDIENTSLYCATWNVNGKELSDPNQTITTLLQLDNTTTSDIYAIGLQEMVDLNVMNVVINSSTSDEKATYWVKKINEAFIERGLEYTCIKEKHMVGILLVVYVKSTKLPAVRDIRTSMVTTGGYGVTGNKGAAALRFDIHDSSVVFLCAHFHANRNNVATRNLDYQTITDTLLFSPNVQREKPAVDASRKARNMVSTLLQKKPNTPYNLLSHEHIFWMGDFNYRIGSDLEDVEVLRIACNGDWPILLEDDQLIHQKAQGNIFHNFEEGPIRFPPTYKYQPGTNDYDTRPDKKMRAPAWCDRILYNSANKVSVIQHAYGALSLIPSDHKPVFATFSVSIRKINMERAHAMYQELLFAIDKWVNASTPKVNLDNRMIDFGLIEESKVYSQTITLSNAGSVLAEWKFIPKSNELMVCKPWFKVSPEDGVLAPGESSTVTVTMKFTPELLTTIPKQSSKEQLMLEEIVILHIKNGSDYFCILSGTLDASHLSEMRKNMQQRKKKKLRGLGRSEKKHLEARKQIESMSISAPTNVVKLSSSSSSFSPVNSQHSSRELQPDFLAAHASVSSSTASSTAQIEQINTVFSSMVPFSSSSTAEQRRMRAVDEEDTSSDDEDDEDDEDNEVTRDTILERPLVDVEEDDSDE